MDNPYAALGLPPTWQPAPAVWAVGKIEQRSVDGAQTWHVLRMDTPYGVQGFAFDTDTARKIVDALSSQISGIAVARSMPADSGRNGRT